MACKDCEMAIAFGFTCGGCGRSIPGYVRTAVETAVLEEVMRLFTPLEGISGSLKALDVAARALWVARQPHRYKRQSHELSEQIIDTTDGRVLLQRPLNSNWPSSEEDFKNILDTLNRYAPPIHK